MKILQVIHDFLPAHNAGSEIYTYNLSRELAERHEVVVFCTECHPERPQYDLSERAFGGLRVIEAVHNHAFPNFAATYADPEMDRLFRGVLERERPDVVHLQHLQYHSIHYVAEAHRLGIPVVFTLHEYCLQCPRKGLLMRDDLTLCPKIDVARCADCLSRDSMMPVVVAGSEAPPAPARTWWAKLRRRLARRDGSGPEPRNHEAEIRIRREQTLAHCGAVDLFIAPSPFLRQKFIDFGFDEARIRFSDYGFIRDGYREPRKLSSGLRFGFIGTIAEYKGVHLIVDAFDRLPPSDAEVRIYGELGFFPDYVERLRKSTHKSGCKLMGRFDNDRIAEILADLDVLIVPSMWFENSPLTIHEAFLAGVPVITADLGGMADLVHDGVNGLLFERGNAASLADVMSRVIDEPSVLADLRAGIEPVKSIEQDARDHERIYRELIQARSGSGAGAGAGKRGTPSTS